MQRSFISALAVAGLLSAPLAHADYLWMQTEGSQARVRAGELRKPLEQLPALSEARVILPNGQPMSVQDGQFSIADSKGDLRYNATRAGGDGVLTYFQARYGREDTRAVNSLELVPTTPNGNTFQLMFKGRPLAASQVNVETSEGWYRTLKPASDGTVSFTPSFPGWYVLEVTARVDNGSVTLDGKKYTDVRHTATLSFEVKPSAAQ